MDAGPSTQPFVGRERQFRELASAAAVAATGHGSLLLLTGEAGIGKTRLATELAAWCRGRGLGVLWAACWEGEGAPAFWPWIQLIRAYVRAADPDLLHAELGASAPEIARLVPEVAAGGQEAPGRQADSSQEARFRVYDAVTTFLGRVARGRPHLVVLDDLHWADEPSLQLLRFLAADLRESGLLVVGTYRDLEVGAAHPLARVIGEMPGGIRLIRLDGLSVAEVSELMSALSPDRPPEADLVRSVHDRTTGNPFFVREVLRLRDKGAERARDVPSGVRAVVDRRLRQLSTACGELLGDASIVGAQFTLPLLGEVTDVASPRLVDLVEEAVAARILEEVAAAAQYRFSHALIREVLASRLPAQRRRALHGRIGAALEAGQAGDVDGMEAELALHFRSAGGPADLRKALDYTERAARHSLALRAHEDAAEHFRRALELLELVAPAERTRRGELLLALGGAQMAAGQLTDGRRTHQRAAAAARELGAPALLARAALGLGTEFAAGGTDDLQVGLLEEALVAVGDSDPALRALLLARLAEALLFSPEHDRRCALADEATDIARAQGDPAILAAVLAARHQALTTTDRPEERLLLADEVVALGEAAGDRTRALEGRALRLADLVQLGRIDQVREELDVYARLLGELGRVSFQWHVPLHRAHLAALGGRFEEAERFGAESLALGSRVQHQGIEAFHQTVNSSVAFLRGRMEAQVEPLRRVVLARPAWITYRAGLALALSHAGRDDEARAEFERMAAADFRDVPRDLLWLPNLALLAVTCAHVHDEARAPLLYELLRPYAPYNVPLSRIAGTLGSCEHYLGLLAATAGRWGEAVLHFEAALAAHARQGFPPLVASSRYRLAGALAHRGGPGDAARAAADLAAAESLARTLAIRLAPGEEPAARPPAAVETTSLRLEGDLWTLTHRGRLSHLRDAVGIGLLARLLREPNREFHVLDLSSARGRSGVPASDSGPVLDEQAKQQYRRRLRELAEEIEEAEAWGDPERGARARQEADLLTDQLVQAVGLGGRDRRPGSDAERARVAVTKALRTAIRRVGEHESDLGAHLSVSVRTGTFCAYAPDPASAVNWSV